MALQMLYAWEIRGGPAVGVIAKNLVRLNPARSTHSQPARELATEVVDHLERLDGEIDFVAAGWPLSRIGAVERNIIRLSLHELLETDVPPKVVIDEGVRLAHWFAGEKAPGFVNGVLDALARRHGRL